LSLPSKDGPYTTVPAPLCVLDPSVYQTADGDPGHLVHSSLVNIIIPCLNSRRFKL